MAGQLGINIFHFGGGRQSVLDLLYLINDVSVDGTQMQCCTTVP